MRSLLAFFAAGFTFFVISTSGAWAGDPIMPLSQVQAGMQCTGYSVVSGTTISPFNVTVLSIVGPAAGDSFSGGSMILISVSGPAVAGTGIGEGFSGSPIYCPDNTGTMRVIGAISEGIGYYGGTTGLATPIQSMLANSATPPPGGRLAQVHVRGQARVRTRRKVPRTFSRQLSLPLNHTLYVSGLRPRLAKAFKQAAAKMGRRVIVVGSSGSGVSFPPQQLVPGAAVSVNFSLGDIFSWGIGTVTYVNGNNVWAFGHPLEGLGARSLILGDAYVFGVVNDPNPDDQNGGTYKLVSPGHILGTLTNDTETAVVGVVGKKPQTISVRVNALDGDTGATLQTNTTTADETSVKDPDGFSPLSLVAPYSVANAQLELTNTAPLAGLGDLCTTIRFKETRTPARFCNRYVTAGPGDNSGGSLVGQFAGNDLYKAVSFIDNYLGSPIHVKSVVSDFKFRRGRRQAFLRAIKMPKRVHRGQSVRVTLLTQQARGGPLRFSFKMRIPRSLKPGSTVLTFTGPGLDSGNNSGGSTSPGSSTSRTTSVAKQGSSKRLPKWKSNKKAAAIAKAGAPGAGLLDVIAAINSISRFDGVSLKIGQRAKYGYPVYLAPNWRLSGSASASIQVTN